MRREIEWVEQRTRRYWYEDGLGELAIGCVVLLVGLLFLVEGLAPTGLLPDHFSSLGLIVLVFGGSWLANRVVATLKARLTYPRTGYVAYRRPTARRRILTGVAAGALGALVAGVLRAAPAALAWIPLLQGLLIAAFLLYLAHTLGLARFYVLALCSTLAGVAAALAGLGDTLGDAAYFTALGAALLISGGLTLRAYLRQTHPRAED